MHNLMRQHLQALKQVLNRFSQHKMATLLICLVIATTLTLPSVMYQVITSLQGLVGDVKSESQISLFLSSNADETTIANIKTSIEKTPNVKSVQFISKDDALKTLESSTHQPEVLSALENNPLPDAFIVEPASVEESQIAQLKAAFDNMDGVEEVLVDSAWIKRLNYLLALGNKAMWILVCLLGFALIIIIGNTIRMQIMSQQAEIELSHLIGATKHFIRRPFLYAGALYGLLSGLLALVLTCAVIGLFNRSILPLANEYQTDFTLSYPSTLSAIVICTLSLAIGVASAHFAVSKSYLKQS
jgi:cell division transport system permease protein